MKLQIAIDGKNYEVDVEVIEDDETPRLPNYGPYQPFQATVPSSTAPSQQTASTTGTENIPEEKVSRSPVAGVVNKVNVKPGQDIKANDVLIVLEAMKMETNVAAAVDGKVKAIRVAQGDSVKVNQIVVELE